MTLLIMAAGLGTRFKGGIKQLTKVGKDNKTLMEYSIDNAEKVGFNNIVIIIRKELESEFKKIFGNKKNIKYVYQEISNVPLKYKNIKRDKPWGTAHAILCCKNVIKEPFCVINADDYYGIESFKLIFNNLSTNENCMIAYHLSDTVNDGGNVNRGLCNVRDSYLLNITETKNIIKKNNKISVGDNFLKNDCLVSMNFFGFNNNIFKYIEEEFITYLDNYNGDEFLIPTVVDSLINKKLIKVKVIETNDKWFGITYKEDLDKIVI